MMAAVPGMIASLRPLPSWLPFEHAQYSAAPRNTLSLTGMEEEGTRWSHRSSKPAWQPLRLPEGSTPSPLRPLKVSAHRTTTSIVWPWQSAMRIREEQEHHHPSRKVGMDLSCSASRWVASQAL